MFHTKYTRMCQICTALKMMVFTSVTVITFMMSMIALA